MKLLLFEDFIKSGESGRLLVNPFWMEYLLDLFYQGYYGEVWEEIQDTNLNTIKTIESAGYGVIANNSRRKHGTRNSSHL